METILEQLVGQYQINIGTDEFWPAYWINWNTPPYFLNAPYRGKASPAQLQLCANQYLHTGAYSDPDSARAQLKTAGIGIDCSGFVYHILNMYLKNQGLKRLAKYLVVGEEDILATVERHPNLFRLPPNTSILKQIPLSAFCRLSHKNPVMLTNVARLVSLFSSEKIDLAKDVRPADMIKMTSRYGDHVAIVTRVKDQEIVYVASEDDEDGLGGIRYRTIKVTDWDKPLELQDWDQIRIYSPHETNDGVYRLKVLADSSRE